MKVILNWYPNATNPVNYKRSAWGTDPYSLGSFPFAGVGASPEDFEEYQEAESTGNKIYFAGDGTTCPMQGSVHGAYVTGIKASQQIAGVYDDSFGVTMLSVNITAFIVLLFTYAL